MQPTAEAIASMPQQAAAAWKTRKAEIAKQAEALSKRRADQNTLNQKAIFAHLEGKMSDANFEIAQKTIEENLTQIDREISDLDSERSTIDEIVQQAHTQAVDLKAVWPDGNVNQRQELARTFFPEGLYFSEEKKFFEPRNTIIQQMIKRFFDDLLVVGVPDGI